MRFSIIIPTYKRQDTLILCLNSLEHYFQSVPEAQFGHQVEVIVTDDAHEVSVQSLLARQYPWCNYVKGPRRGPSANRNHGARNASGDWIVFTDDDCLPQPGWIESYAALSDQVELLEGRTSAAGVRTRVDEECPINETGGFLWSCNFAIKRQSFFALGGFNEDFPAAAMEDVEFNLRANKAGLTRAFVPDALVLHPWRLRKDRSFVEAYSRSVAKFVHLHPEMSSRFSLARQLHGLARSFKRNILHSISTGQWSGLSRQIYLDSCSCFLAWNAVRRDMLG